MPPPPRKVFGGPASWVPGMERIALDWKGTEGNKVPHHYPTPPPSTFHPIPSQLLLPRHLPGRILSVRRARNTLEAGLAFHTFCGQRDPSGVQPPFIGALES